MTHPTFRYAITRKPAPNFADGLTTADLGKPDYETALQQHAAYCQALRACGLALIELEADPRYPDSTFVEDAAVLTHKTAVLTHPGAASREGEVAAIRGTVARFYERICAITAPGTLDGGDICEAESQSTSQSSGQSTGHFFIGVSERTNEAGARQLADFLAQEGYTSSAVPVTGIPGILHLKSGIAYLGENRLVAIDAFAGRPEFQGYEIIRVEPEETYAANCIRVNDAVIMPDGFPRLRRALELLGYPVIALEMTEFQKMDGGVSCLSLRF